MTTSISRPIARRHTAVPARDRARAGAIAIAMAMVLALTTTGCGGGGDLVVRNDGPDDVSVMIPGEAGFTVTADGEVQVIGLGCTDADVDLTFPSGETLTLAGPVCPDDLIVIRDGEVHLREP